MHGGSVLNFHLKVILRLHGHEDLYYFLTVIYVKNDADEINTVP